MNLLVVLHGLLFGGAQVSTLEFLRLIKGKKDVRVILCENADKMLVREIFELGISVKRVPCRNVFGYPDMVVEGASELIRWADIVWISDESYMVAPKIKQIRDVPVVAHLRSYALICPWWGASYELKEVCLKRCNVQRFARCKQMITYERWKAGELNRFRAEVYRALSLGKALIDYARWPLRDKYILDNIDGFISVSKATWEIHLRHIPELRSKPFEVVYGTVSVPDEIVEESLGKGGDERLRIAYIEQGGGLLVKGPHIYLQALKILINEGLKFEAVMVGCKGTWVESYAYRLGIAKSVTFYGRLKRSELYKLMSSLSTVVVPSVWPEPFGRVALEANYLGVPVVASRIGGLVEIVEDGITGFLVEPGSPVALAEGIIKALTAKFSRDKIHSITAVKFNGEAIISRFLKFLSRFLR